MPMILRSAILLMSLVPQVASAQPMPEVRLDALEETWHGCVREAFTHQPRTQSRAASQRSALDACQAQEDAFVAAAMTEAEAASRERRGGQPGRSPALTERLRARVASIASEVIEPVSSWFSGLRR
ncbi:hypothetical protein ASF49_12685 [Methylobacterium sp. Leaf104]|uniref:hypothetical protein n=1 Tax=Methylobacterium TaxID=407 RepID=UPI000701DD79|nr:MULTISPECIES: hypothetical protein [Methylobacterium]KQP30822.1 hypothetical protein ASF49_12685 [Methylobacterium sp. Leaf104]MCI9882185.1 hypothetical protein [Methylobacterium goesingense]